MSGSENVVEWQIVNKVQETSQTFTYTFSMSTKLEIALGQFVTIGAFLKRPTVSGGIEESYAERAYSIASSPDRKNVEITIKCEKPYGYINPKLKKADGFAAYFFEQLKIGDKVKVKLGTKKDHFLSKVASSSEKNIAYWSGANGAESARGLIQYMEDNPDLGFALTLFYSNPHLYLGDTVKTVDVIYYNWLIEKAKKMENLKVIFTFTRDNEILTSDHPRIIFRKGRFFVDLAGGIEKTLTKYHDNPKISFNPICGSSGFITGVTMDADGHLVKGRGIVHDLMDVEDIGADKIDKEQFYLDQSH
jgi:NAD(P)H-flavin reductase